MVAKVAVGEAIVKVPPGQANKVDPATGPPGEAKKPGDGREGAGAGTRRRSIPKVLLGQAKTAPDVKVAPGQAKTVKRRTGAGEAGAGHGRRRGAR